MQCGPLEPLDSENGQDNDSSEHSSDYIEKNSYSSHFLWELIEKYCPSDDLSDHQTQLEGKKKVYNTIKKDRGLAQMLLEVLMVMKEMKQNLDIS